MITDFTRQSGLVSEKSIRTKRIVLIGAGAIGSFTALALTKLGVSNITIYDEDGVSKHNLPNQFYRIGDCGKFKVNALTEIITEFNGEGLAIKPKIAFYDKQVLSEITIAATDTMASRKQVFDQFCKQDGTRYLIEARMGGEIGFVYCIDKLNKAQMKCYSSRLYTDEKSTPIPCTERSIIYNILMISSLICRAFKAIINEENGYPFELIFDMRTMELYKEGENGK